MKITVPGTILATSLNLGAMVTDKVPQGAVGARLPEETQRTGDASVATGVASVIDAADEFYTVFEEVPVDIDWDKVAEKHFQSLAIKEAIESLSASELVELEQLTIARRKHTAPPVSAKEMFEEFRQWQSVNRVFEALDRYVQEIGLRRTSFTNRP